MTAWITITKPTVGTGVSKADFGDDVIDNLEYLNTLKVRSFFVPLNGATALVTGDKAYYFVDEDLAGATVLTARAACHVASTSGNVVLTAKNNDIAMLSTNITMSQNKRNTLTDTPAVVIPTTLVYGDWIEISVINAGTGVTYCGVSFRIRPA